MEKSGFVAIWEFRVRGGQSQKFEKVYGEAGEWVRLFRQSPDFRGTRLLKDRANPARFITIDEWSSQESYERFRELHAPEYRAIDETCESLTEAENEIGRFEKLKT